MITPLNVMVGEETHTQSIEPINARDVFPPKPTHRDDPTLLCPFKLLTGENVLYLGRASEAIVTLSDFRLFIQFRNSFINIPLGLIESVECRDVYHLHILCKNAHYIRCTFSTSEQCQNWYLRLSDTLQPPSRDEDIFAFPFHMWRQETLSESSPPPVSSVVWSDDTTTTTTTTQSSTTTTTTSDITSTVDYCVDGSNGSVNTTTLSHLCQPSYKVLNYFKYEFVRMGFDRKVWKQTKINEKHRLIKSYPETHIVPALITDDDIRKVMDFRSSRRFPTVVYRHKSNGAVIVRCSQPEVGWFSWRCDQDENLMKALSSACAHDNPLTSTHTQTNVTMTNGVSNGTHRNSSDPDITEPLSLDDCPLTGSYHHNITTPVEKKVLIVDARSYTAAVANRAKGGGCECHEYYSNCEIMFMGLANIHSIRKSFHTVRNLCSLSQDQANWLSSLENTRWLQHISLLLKSSLCVANAVDIDRRPVVVHCSDGWDRTPQIVSLAELMLDSYYRTIEGFQVLVEREWLDFGHKFADRCGHSLHVSDSNEHSPVFLQWLDCVHQLMHQFPCAFQFNEAFLVKLVHHCYSRLFGTFLCNTAAERCKIRTRTCSVWSLLRSGRDRFRNPLFSDYCPTQVLRPACQVRALEFWSTVYLSTALDSSSHGNNDNDSSVTQGNESPEDGPGRMPKTRSCDNLRIATAQREDELQQGLPRTTSDPNLRETKIPLKDDEDIADNFRRRKSFDASLEVGRQGQEIVPKHPSQSSVEHERLNQTNNNNNITYITDDITDRQPMCNGHHTASSSASSDTDQSEGGLETTTTTEEEDRARSEDVITQTEAGDYNDVFHLTSRNMEGSTDTLTERGAAMTASSDTLLCNGHVNNVVDDGDRSSSMCTSTSEISSSVINKARNGSATSHHTDSHVINTDSKFSSENTNAVNHHFKHADGTLLSATSHPLLNYNNSLKYTTSKSTRETDLFDSKLRLSAGTEDKCSTSISRFLDNDGLTKIIQPAQDRLRSMDYERRCEIEKIRHELEEAKAELHRQQLQFNLCCENKSHLFILHDTCDDKSSQPESTASSSDQTGPSLYSWEHIDEDETLVTRWVPDHAATHCSGCNEIFWVALRKHHCRNCGDVFCGRCTELTLPLPDEQLYDPVRVCKQCYRHITGNTGRTCSMTELDEALINTSNTTSEGCVVTD